jgi:hypothetical protein
MDNAKKIPSIGRGLIWVYIGIAFFEGVRLALGHTEDLRNSMVRSVFVAGCFFVAFFYQAATKDQRLKTLFGVLQLVIAVLSLWYQLTKLGQSGWAGKDVVDRLTFVVGSIALLSKGIKDLDDATKKLETPSPSPSS